MNSMRLAITQTSRWSVNRQRLTKPRKASITARDKALRNTAARLFTHPEVKWTLSPASSRDDEPAVALSGCHVPGAAARTELHTSSLAPDGQGQRRLDLCDAVPICSDAARSWIYDSCFMDCQATPATQRHTRPRSLSTSRPHFRRTHHRGTLALMQRRTVWAIILLGPEAIFAPRRDEGYCEGSERARRCTRPAVRRQE